MVFSSGMVTALSVSLQDSLLFPSQLRYASRHPKFGGAAASQEGHKQPNSEPLLIKLLPNPVTRKAQPWHVSLRRDLAREPPQPPAALGGEMGKQGPKSAPNLPLF